MIYLDNSATTRPFDGVIDVMDRCMREQYFNASAAYKPAVDVDRAMRECRKTIAAQLGIQESGVIFTGGGTESDNLAILGTAAALRQSANFVCSAIEHPAVAETIRRVEQMGLTVRVLPIDARGVVDLAACETVIDEHTALVSCMQVSNETGAIQPVEALNKLARRKNPNVRIHVDGVQGFMRVPMHMERMGVDCLKIEGRLKRPEYVAVVTGIYRRLLDERRLPTAEESAALEQAFSRSGFTDGYWLGRKGKAMFGTRPENVPEPKELFARARETYENGKENRKIPVNLRLTVRRGEPVRLGGACAVRNGVTIALATGDAPEEARNRAVTEEELRQRLAKTGGTVFAADQIEIELDEGLMVSASAVNALRRELLDELADRRMDTPKRRELPASPLPEAPAGAAELDFTVSISRPDQLTAELLAERPAIVYIPAELLDKMDLMPYTGQAEFCAVLPRIFRTADEPVFRDILQRHPEVASAAIGNLGHLAIVKGLGKTLRGDFGLNVYNSRAVRFWQEQGLSSVTANFELRWQQVRDLGKYADCEALVYGRLPLMITENCVTKNSVGCAHGAGSVLTDRRGEQFPVLCAYGCRCEIENGKTLVLADKPEVFRCGLRYGRLRFTTETAAECAALLRAHRAGTVTADDNSTRGLFYRGVE